MLTKYVPAMCISFSSFSQNSKPSSGHEALKMDKDYLESLKIAQKPDSNQDYKALYSTTDFQVMRKW